MIKRVLYSAMLLCAVLLLFSCADSSKELVGAWSMELYGSEEIIEFTDTGDFIYKSTGDISKYKANGSTVTVYVENSPGSEVELDYEIKDNILYFGGGEYVRVINN